MGLWEIKLHHYTTNRRCPSREERQDENKCTDPRNRDLDKHCEGNCVEELCPVKYVDAGKWRRVG